MAEFGVSTTIISGRQACLQKIICFHDSLGLQGPEKRKEYNIKDNLVRFSCGVEDVEDIWNDLDKALEKAIGSRRHASVVHAAGNGGAVPVPAL